MTRGGSSLRVGIIGAGFSARLHAEAYHQVRGVDVALTRVAAARPERAAQFAKEFGVSAVAASAEDVLAAADVDVVDVVVPNHLHEEIGVAALDHGKDVLLEKPMAATLAGAERMIDAVGKILH